ncbi:DUF3391 domain-containing protein [Methylomonas rhizoryzae]|uniref:DUF3391 domain-containing protein n=1 Tax=Methylomonas rhizoryzae TaxID=2608981 RepID=UPI001231D817|nr:DUF3391 domain-containing protein [Methylomonas rhizoryzae]
MIKIIDAKQLTIGMYVCGFDRSWWDLPFYRTRFLLVSLADVQQIQAYCRQVKIDTEKGRDWVPVQTMPAPEPLQVWLFDCAAELDKAFGPDEHCSALDGGDRIVAQLHSGLKTHGDDLLLLCLQAEILQDRQVADLAKALLLLALGLVWKAKQEEALQLCKDGLRLFRSALPESDADPAAALASDNRNAINFIQDFCALSLETPSGRESGFAGAAALLAGPKLKTYDPQLAAHFIDALGLYQPGDIVELNGGELAMVKTIWLQTPRRATVRLLTDPHKRLLENPQELRLYLSAAKAQAIARILAADEPILDLLTQQAKRQTDS